MSSILERVRKSPGAIWIQCNELDSLKWSFNLFGSVFPNSFDRMETEIEKGMETHTHKECMCSRKWEMITVRLPERFLLWRMLMKWVKQMKLMKVKLSNMRMWILNWVDFCFAFQWKIWFYLFGNFCYTLRKPINISTELKDQSSELSLVMWNNNYGIQKMHMYISLHDYGISERVTRSLTFAERRSTAN